MLNKEVCKACWFPQFDESPRHWYDSHFDKMWAEQNAFCRCEQCVVSQNGVPPDKCPYILEHLMKAQINAK